MAETGNGNPKPKAKRELVESFPFLDCGAIALATNYRPGQKGVICWQYHDGEPCSAIVDVEVVNESELLLRHTAGRETYVSVRYLATKPNFGGSRYWFQCWRCERRVRRLYLRHGLLGCRQCYRLVHKSTRTSHYLERAGNFVDRFYEKFGKSAKKDGSPPASGRSDPDDGA